MAAEPALDPETAERYREAQRLACDAPLPARVANIRFGTAGWTDSSLIKSRAFYPKGANKPEARLTFYAQQFAMVEVDASYYSILAPSLSERWLTWTPDHFCFNVKAHSSLTGHPIDLTRLPKSLHACIPALLSDERRAYAKDLPAELVEQMWAGFESFVMPLQVAGRLGCVMLQFPPWFVATKGNARQLELLAERFSGFRLSVEFRHPSWLEVSRRQRVFALLTRLKMCYVAVDEPDVRGGGVPPLVEVTNPELALFRFHGQHVGGWRKGASVAERFNYLYAPSELAPWVHKTIRAARGADQVHAIFNNCVRDFAVLGAKDLAALVAKEQNGGHRQL